VSSGVLGSRVVGVVGGEKRGVETPGYLEQVAHDLLLGGDAVVLDLDEEVVPPEDVLELGGGGQSSVEVAGLGAGVLFEAVVGAEELGHQATETAGGGDHTLRVLGQQLEVHPRLVVVALEERPRGQLHQVLVAGLVFGVEQQVIALVGRSYRPVEPGALGQVCLDPDHRRQVVALGRFHEVDHAVEDAVIGDPHSRLPVLGGDTDHVLDPRRTVQHRILGMEMEVSE
jgi:hypothetical protein